jgi:hypothetical protein
VYDAARIHQEAQLDRRTISGYILTILTRAIDFEERLFRSHTSLSALTSSECTVEKTSGPRTAILLRCTVEEAARIRAAAKQRHASISGFAVHCLRRSWMMQEQLAQQAPKLPGGKQLR